MPAPESVVAAAIEQIGQGFAVFALKADSKVPVTEHGFKNATTRPDWIRRQLEAPAAGNYGLVWPADTAERVVVFDLDDGGGAERPWRDRMLDLVAVHGPLPATKTTATPSGGRHAFYRWPADVPVPAGDELFGFTVRWPGRGYLVGPGSRIGDREYTAGLVTEIAPLPARWVDAALAERRATPRQSATGEAITVTPGFSLPDRIPSGRRYAAVRDYVASRYNAGLGLDELWDLVRTQVAPRFEAAKTDTELRADFDRVTAKIAERLGAPAHGGRQADVAAALVELEDAPLTEFASEPVRWLWDAWLPRGVVTLMDGNPGVSKSTLVADLVARITTGRGWPDGSPGAGRAARAMWITTEDDPGRVLRPRVEAAGGDAGLVRFVKGEVVFPSGAGPFTDLVVRRAAEAEGLALVILDPLFSHIDATVRTIADAEMRKGVMNPLTAAAEAAGVAILVVRHFSKDATASAINRGAGSLGGIVGAARALWTVVPDPEDESGEAKVVGVSKLNYARAHRALRYRVVDRVPPGWLSGSVSGIEWLGEASSSIEAMLSAGPRSLEAARALEEILADGPVAASAAEQRMRARSFGAAAIKGAKARLRVVSAKTSMTGGWTWSLPRPEGDDGADPFQGAEGDAPTPSAPSAARADARAGRDSSSTPSSSSKGPKASKGTALPAGAREEAPVLRVLPADPTGWAKPCLWYRDHQAKHRWTPSGWTCDACHPQEGHPA